MAATAATIKSWFPEGKADKYTHMLVVCDTYDWEDYPIYCKSEEEAREQYAKHNGVNMQRVMEVYRVDLGWDAQDERHGRVMNW